MVNSLVVHIVLKKGSEVSPKLQLSWSSYEHVRIRSTWVCFNHISLIRTQNRAPFFCSIPYFSRNIVQILIIFLNCSIGWSTDSSSFFLGGQLVRRGCLRTTLFLAFLVPLFRLVRALVLQMG